MRWAVMLVAGLLGMAGAVAGLLDARAQQSPVIVLSQAEQLAQGDEADALAGDAPHRPDGIDGPHTMLGWHQGHPWQDSGVGALGLMFTAPDRQLSLGDVRKIAEAYLLWHGNHDWRVTNLATDADRVSFTITTAQNVVIAAFTMDRHSGALFRTG